MSKPIINRSIRFLRDRYSFHLQSAVKVFRNCKTKIYSDGSKNSTFCRVALFKDTFDVSLDTLKDQDFKTELELKKVQRLIDYLDAKQITLDEYYDRRKSYKELLKKEPRPRSDEVRHDSLKRAKDSIFDYILNNEFEYFFTGTLDPEKMDAKNPKEVFKPVLKWLKNMVQRYKMSYILIAERHKSGAIHFHGLFRSVEALRLDDSGTKLYKGYNKPVSNERAEQLGLIDGRTVYNLKTWSFGFSTAVKLQGSRMNTAFYVTKYITKDCKKIFGKFFWHSRDLKRPQIEYSDVDFDEVEAFESNGFKYLFEGGSESSDLFVRDSDSSGQGILDYLNERGVE